MSNHRGSPKTLAVSTVCGVGVLLVISTGQALAADSYRAMTHDGKQISADEVKNWHDEKSSPQISGKPVWDEKTPCKWLLRENAAVAAAPVEYVEFFGGDRLPGRVVQAVGESSEPFCRQPEHVIVETLLPLGFPDKNDRFAVSTRWLQRVVFSADLQRDYRPKTLYLRDRRQFSFNALRWNGESVTLLTSDGVQYFSLNEISEIHLQQRDPWQVYFEQLATLLPEGIGQLVQIETEDGLRLTVSRSRFSAFYRGDKKRSTNWWQRVQPAWSLQPLAVPFSAIRSWRFFSADRPPLALLGPTATVQNSSFGAHLPARSGRSVRGQALRSEGDVFVDGFGVHARSELSFEVPDLVTGLHTLMGLDRSAGDGGCVRMQIFLDSPATDGNTPAPKKLFESEVLAGCGKVVDSGELKWSAPADKLRSTLRLVVDPLNTTRPAGADPFDIRDHANWFQPELRLDTKQLELKVREQLPQVHPALANWNFDPAVFEDLRFFEEWDQTFAKSPTYRPTLAVAGPFAVFSQKMNFRKNDRWLAVVVARPHTGHNPRVQVRVDGRAMAEFVPPVGHHNQEPEPVLVPIHEFRGRSVNVELVQFGDQKNEPPRQAALDWRGVVSSVHRPTLRALFDEQPRFFEQLTLGEGQVALELQTAYRGERSLRVTGGATSNPAIPGWSFSIAEQPRLGEFRFLRFAWKKTNGKQIAMEIGHGGQLGGDGFVKGKRRFIGPGAAVRKPPRQRSGNRLPSRNFGKGFEYDYRYAAGRSGLDLEAGYWLDRKLPLDWKLQNCDLFNDFGEFTLTGLGLMCPDGEMAYFDNIYLARTNNDFRWIDRPEPTGQTDDKNVIAWEREPERYGLLVSSLFPLFSCRDAAEGVHAMKEYGGQQNVLAVKPRSKSDPCVLTAAVHVPESSKTLLALNVAAEAGRKWRLVVKGNGDTLKSQNIESKENIDWQAVEVDLSKYAGKRLLLEVMAATETGTSERAHFQRVEVVTR